MSVENTVLMHLLLNTVALTQVSNLAFMLIDISFDYSNVPAAGANRTEMP